MGSNPYERATYNLNGRLLDAEREKATKHLHFNKTCYIKFEKLIIWAKGNVQGMYDKFNQQINPPVKQCINRLYFTNSDTQKTMWVYFFILMTSLLRTFMGSMSFKNLTLMALWNSCRCALGLGNTYQRTTAIYSKCFVMQFKSRPRHYPKNENSAFHFQIQTLIQLYSQNNSLHKRNSISKPCVETETQ